MYDFFFTSAFSLNPDRRIEDWGNRLNVIDLAILIILNNIRYYAVYLI